LSLKNEPEQLLDIALDAISKVFEADCCWIQFINPDNELSLAAFQDFTALLQEKMGRMDLRHPFGKEIAGTGNSIVIPDLSRDGRFDISLFEQEGFRSLVAVPIITYRVHGIMGAAFRARKRFTEDDSGLLSAIAGMIGMAYHKCLLLKTAAGPENLPAPDASTPEQEAAAEDEQSSQVNPDNGADKEHSQRMRVFRDSHRKARSRKVHN
jgi:GAF domain-containing protein